MTIDRPVGSSHPVHGFLYPVNYGYLPGTRAADGEAIDAYVLGVPEPVDDVQGQVIAVVLRANDVEDKLVVAPAGVTFTAASIREQIAFQEQFFDSQIVLAEA